MSELSGVEETMTEIRRNWNVMLQDQVSLLLCAPLLKKKFNPIMVALEMLQNSNPSHDYDAFLRLHAKLEESMAIIVEKYYTGFNNAVSIFGGIVDNTRLSKDIVGKVKKDVEEFRDQIQYKRTELPEIWAKVQQYKDTIAVTGKLEQVQKQQALALQIAARKFFIPATRTLMSAVYDARYLNSTQNSPATDLIKALESNRDTLFESIMDELNNLIFLKEMKPSQQLFSRLTEKIPETKSLAVGLLKKSTEMTFEICEDDLVLAPTEFDFKADSNAIAYLKSLVKSAAILELLPQMLSILAQRIVSELYQMTEKCLAKAMKEFRRGLDVFDGPVLSPILRGGMEKSEGRELDAFIPVLRRLCENVFGHFLTTANTIQIVGECVEQIVQESGSSIDIRAFYKNCLSAIHGEVKNFLACFLHGSQTTTRVFTNPTLAISEALKGPKAPKTVFKAPLYQFVNLAEETDLPAMIDLSTVLSKREETASRKLASMLVVDPFSASSQDVGHRAFVKPNTQYLAVMYGAYTRFDFWLDFIFPEDQAASRFVDSTFVESVLSEEYIPAIENYVLQDLTRSFNSAESLLWHSLTDQDQTLAVGKSANSLLMCVSTFIGLLSQILCVLHQIPGSQPECEQLMLTLMAQFLEKCDAKFRDMVTSKAILDEASPTFVAISSSFVANQSLRELLAQHSMLAGAEDAGMDAILSQKESLLLEKLKSDRSLHRNEIIFDYRLLRSIALLQRSLELLPSIICDASFGTIPSFPVCRPEFRRDDSGKLVSNFFDRVTRNVIPLSPAFETQYENFLSAVQSLSRTCLFMLRIELRMHGFYFLDLAYREGNYDFDEFSNEPDPYVSSLANDLIRFESLVSEWLPYSRYHLVMDELAQSLVGMLIADFRYIRSLNAFGCRKLEINVATLEQVLTLVSADTAADLQPARDFYRLAGAGPERFIELAPKLDTKFTMQQYQSIFDVYYRDNSGDASLHRTYSNQLIRLKYLLENECSDDSKDAGLPSELPPRK